MKEQTISIIPKTKPKPPSWVNILIGFSVGVLLISGGVFGFLMYQMSYMETDQENLNAEILILNNSNAKELEGELLSLAKRIKDFAQLFEKHRYSSSVFAFLKSACHPRVQFTSMNFNLEGFQVNLNGRTESFKTLGEQLFWLKTDTRLQNLELSSVSLNQDGAVDFALSFNLHELLFQ